MASKRVATLSAEAKAELARELVERAEIARVALEGFAHNDREAKRDLYVGMLGAMMTGLPFVVEELHRDMASPHPNLSPGQGLPPASAGILPEPLGPMIVHRTGRGPTRRHADTVEMRAACGDCQAKGASP